VKALTRLGIEVPGAAPSTAAAEGTDKVVPIERSVPLAALPEPSSELVSVTPKPVVTKPVVPVKTPTLATKTPEAAQGSAKHAAIDKSPPKVGGVTKSLLNEDSLDSDFGFDLASELADDFAEAASSEAEEPARELQFSVEDVPSEIKKGVTATVSEGDFATHYDLGIAYKEMGLTDEAIREFEISSRAPEKHVDSQSMVGVCRMELGDHKGAIEAFKKASNSDHISAQQSVAIQYELATAHAASGDADTAKSLFTKVAKLDPKFRDAAARAADSAPATTPGAEGETLPAVKKGKISYL